MALQWLLRLLQRLLLRLLLQCPPRRLPQRLLLRPNQFTTPATPVIVSACLRWRLPPLLRRLLRRHRRCRLLFRL